jgi:tRNA pseudouridine38-40 synthase
VSPAERRIRFDLAYDGTEYAGWQTQPGVRTVQETVERAASRISGDRPVRVRGAGRTDAGVHARQQVADASLATRLDDEELLRALRGLLPPDVRPLRVTSVQPDFHARILALSKTYRYRLDRTSCGDPFLARFALHQPRPMDRAALEESLSRLPGRRDWAGFAGAASEVENTVRDLSEASYVEPAPGLGVFTFTADGFLNHMVRNLVGTLLEIARGRFSPDRIDEVLQTGDRRLAGPTAPARGLCLERVRYPDEDEPSADAVGASHWSLLHNPGASPSHFSRRGLEEEAEP